MPMPSGLNPRQRELWISRKRFLGHLRDSLVELKDKGLNPYEAKINMSKFLNQIADVCTCTYQKAEDYFFHFDSVLECFTVETALKEHETSFTVLYEAIKDNKYDIVFPKP